MELRETPEPNLWKIVERRPLDQGEPPPRGFIGVYVGDFIVVGAKDIVKGALSRIEMEWKCSPAEWVSSERWTKFSGFELRWSSAEEDSGLYVGPRLRCPFQECQTGQTRSRKRRLPWRT